MTLQEAEDRVRRFLRVAGASRPDDIIRAMEAHGIREAEVRRAFWRMLGSYEVMLTPDRKLALNP